MLRDKNSGSLTSPGRNHSPQNASLQLVPIIDISAFLWPNSVLTARTWGVKMTSAVTILSVSFLVIQFVIKQADEFSVSAAEERLIPVDTG